MDFRPSVVILADAAGNTIFEQFRSSGLSELLGNFQEPLLHAIGLIRQVDAHPPIFQCQLLSDSIEYNEESLMHALRSMQDRVEIKRVAGITLSQPLPHIYVIGHMNSPEVRSTIREIRDQGVKDLEISAIFSCDPHDEVSKDRRHGDLVASRNTDSMTPELAAWARQYRVRFCYLYGDVSKDVYTAHRKAGFDYAAAEALFFFLTSGSVLEKQFQPSTSYHHGTLSTCMIVSPRDAIRSACAAGATRILLTEWRDIIKKHAEISEDELEREATTYINKLRNWIMHDHHAVADVSRVTPTHIWQRWSNRDDRSAMSDVPIFSPPVELLRQHDFQDKQIAQYKEEQQKLMIHTGELVQGFVFDPALHPSKWLEKFPQARADRATQSASPEAMAEEEAKWTNAHVRTWDALENYACTNLKNSIENIGKTKGLGWAIAYCDKVNDKLSEMAREIVQLREATLDELSATTLASGQNRSPTMPVNVRSLYETIEEKAHLKPTSSPLPFTLVSMIAALMTSITLWFLLSAFVSRQNGLLQNLLLGALLVCCPAGTFWARNVYLKRATAKLTQAQKELLAYYQRARLLQCRLYHLARLRALIDEARNSLRGMTTAYIKEVEEGFGKKAQEAFASLFRTEASQRDLFCGNAAWLKSLVEARKQFLPTEIPLKSRNPSPVERIFKNIGGEDKDNLVLLREIGLLASYTNPEGNSFPVILQRAMPEIVARLMSSSDFTINLKERDMWERVPQHFSSPPLWQKQNDMARPSVIVLCASKNDNEKAKEQLSAACPDSPILDAEIIHFTRETAIPGYSTNWLLVAAFYAQSDAEPIDLNR
jgi:hypothetical protein